MKNLYKTLNIILKSSAATNIEEKESKFLEEIV
jgi:hypothetical protein